MATFDFLFNTLTSLVSQPIRYAGSVTVTCAAAGAYAAGDVLSSTTTNNVGQATYVPNLARNKGQPFTIVAVRATSSNVALLSRMRCYWFATSPSPIDVEMDDNAVFSITTATGRLAHAGSTLTNAFRTTGTSDTAGLQDAIRTDPNETGSYLVLTTEDAETNQSANQTIRLDFYTL